MVFKLAAAYDRCRPSISMVQDGAIGPVNRVNFSALDGESFAAMMSLLNSHDKLLYNPVSKVLFSAR